MRWSRGFRSRGLWWSGRFGWCRGRGGVGGLGGAGGVEG